MHKLDDIDRQLLHLLQEDDRLSLAELGKRIGIPASTINDRIKRLSRNGVTWDHGCAPWTSGRSSRHGHRVAVERSARCRDARDGEPPGWLPMTV